MTASASTGPPPAGSTGPPPAVAVRPLEPGDIEALTPLVRDALEGVSQRLDAVPHPRRPDTPQTRAWSHARYRHVLEHDPDGAWVAVDEAGTPLGACLALRRDGLWMLSLLAVDNRLQGQGLGRRLLDAGLQTAADATSGLICVSRDVRAMRRYHGAGFALLPCYFAEGVLDRAALPATPGVRVGDLGRDGDLVDDVVRMARGSGIGPDLAWQLANGCQLFVAEHGANRGFALVQDGRVQHVGATEPGLAQQLLWAALASAGPDGEVVVPWMTGAQQWAVDVAMAARLRLMLEASLGVRGDLGPMAPYLPSGIYG